MATKQQARRHILAIAQMDINTSFSICSDPDPPHQPTFQPHPPTYLPIYPPTYPPTHSLNHLLTHSSTKALTHARTLEACVGLRLLCEPHTAALVRHREVEVFPDLCIGWSFMCERTTHMGAAGTQ